LKVLKTTESGFVGYHQDAYTTLAETTDRIFATTITADWTADPSSNPKQDWSQIRQEIRGELLDVFANRYSPSVQKTLHEMSESVLAKCPSVMQISLNMPNQHHLPADLAKMNLQNNNDIFVPTSEPFGVISATLRRDV
jgi:urate oxidase